MFGWNNDGGVKKRPFAPQIGMIKYIASENATLECVKGRKNRKKRILFLIVRHFVSCQTALPLPASRPGNTMIPVCPWLDLSLAP